MHITKAHNLACPIDGERLEILQKQLVCRHGHTFDVARQGYVNLLPVQHKRSRQPGDNKEMVAARSRFLSTGLYEPVAGKLAAMIKAQVSGNESICILDAGCGEGYYLDQVFHALKDREGQGELSFIGLDISKHAILESARRNKGISWVVGTNRQPPIEAASVDIIICVFGFQSFDGFRQVLKPGGRVILVGPGSDHLGELREIIYTEVRQSAPKKPSGSAEERFALTDSQELRFNTGPIDNDMINDLLLMTPHFYKANKQRRELAVNLPSLELTVDVVFRLFEKTG